MGVALIAIPLLAGTVLTFIYIERISDESRRLVIRSLEIGRETEKLVGGVDELSRTARQYDVVGDEDLYYLYAQKHRRLTNTVEWLGVLVKEQEAQQVLSDIKARTGSAFQQVQLKAQSPDNHIATKVFDELDSLTESFRAFANQAIRSQVDAATKTVEKTRSVLYVTWVASSLFIGAFIVVLTWFIARPIRQMDSQIRRLGRGKFDGSIEIEGPDDISELGNRLDWLRARLAEVDSIKEQFFREMSHQLKTPLASIREASDILMDDAGKSGLDRHREVLEILQDNSIELQRILDNMLNFSAWRADPGRLYKERFCIKHLVQLVVQRFRSSLLARSLEFHVECPDELMVEMDREKCRIILDNLVSNAVKFSPERGRITIRIAERRGNVLVQVCDEGPGIPADECDRIFELFYTGDRPSVGGSHGTGIGLSLVRAYAEAHGGNVYVDTKYVGGARVEVSMPRE